MSKKSIVKQYCSGGSNPKTDFIIRLSHYGKLLSYFLELYEEAKKDFPELKLEDVEVVQYGGARVKGYHGIEFSLEAEAPEGYEYVKYLEYTK